MQPTKPGVKTTEFYVSSTLTIICGILAMGVIPHSTEILQIVGAVGALLSSMGYTWARTKAKQNGG